MERESFENEEVAQLLNEVCVNIKVDREVLPDVDRVYMTYIQATSGRGGWPMSVFLIPDKLLPFYGGTYFPPEAMKQILTQIEDKWQHSRERLIESATTTRTLIADASAPSSSSSAIDPTKVRKKALAAFENSYDSKHGGFGRAPKFPTESIFSFLHTYTALHRNDLPLEMSAFTLTKMAQGGIHDQLGLGFHRYSVDAIWHIPHFEIMLYDNAQLITHYLTYAALSGSQYHADVATGILNYLNRNLLSPGKAYMSAEDAESFEKEGDPIKQEGAFYVWTVEQITAALGKEDAEIFIAHFGVESDGNVQPQHDPHGELQGKNVLMEQGTIADTARRLGKDVAKVEKAIERGRTVLAVEREKRPRPHLDDKIIASWNGMMLIALAHASVYLPDGSSWYEQGMQIVSFLRQNIIHDNSVLRCYGTNVEGVADDYALIIRGLLSLYQVQFDSSLLALAVQLQQKHDALFWDDEAGGYFASAAHSDASKIMRLKDDSDGAEPSANSTSLQNLITLDAILHSTDPALLGLQSVGDLDTDMYATSAEQLIQAFSGTLQSHPHSMPEMVAAVMVRDVGVKCVIVSSNSDEEAIAFVNAVRGDKWWPDVLFVKETGGKGKTTGRVCFAGTCGMPKESEEELRKEIMRLRAP